MTRPSLLLIFLLALALQACERNFDELQDSDQRHIDFRISVDDLFSDVLICTDGQYALMQSKTIGAEEQLRVSVYCYDEAGNLVVSSSVLRDDLTTVSTRVKHLCKNQTYHFVFLADIVRRDEALGYIENWYHLQTTDHSLSYLLCNDFQKSAADNVIRHFAANLTPANQSVEVRLQPVTRNGFLVLTHTDDIFQFDVSFSLSKSLTLKDMLTRKRESVVMRTTFPDGADVVVPFTATLADDAIPVNIEIMTNNSSELSSLIIENEADRPVVIVYDCNKKQITDKRVY